MRLTGERPRVFLQERQRSDMSAMINAILAAATSKVTIPNDHVQAVAGGRRQR